MPEPRLTLADFLLRGSAVPAQAGPNQPYVSPPAGPIKATLRDLIDGGVDLFMGALGLPGTPNTKARQAGELLSMAPLGSMRSMAKLLSKEEMLRRGADGYLSRAYEARIPISKLDGLEPTPMNVDAPDGTYTPGRQIIQPIEVAYDAANDKYIVYAGNHRVAQARANNDATIPAFIEPDQGKWRKP